MRNVSKFVMALAVIPFGLMSFSVMQLGGIVGTVSPAGNVSWA